MLKTIEHQSYATLDLFVSGNPVFTGKISATSPYSCCSAIQEKKSYDDRDRMPPNLARVIFSLSFLHKTVPFLKTS